MNHVIFDYTLVVAVMTWVGSTGYSVYRDRRERKNGVKKITMIEIKEALIAARDVGVAEIEKSQEVSMRPLVSTLERIERINEQSKDLLIEMLATLRSR